MKVTARSDSVIKYLDRIIRNLGDATHYSSPPSLPPKKRKRSPRSDDGDSVSASPPPPGLESQHASLHALLRRGLVGFRGRGGAKNSVASTRGNVSALLMGPRGHGKTLVLERCLASLRAEARREAEAASSSGDEGFGASRTKDSFRVVRLNGLLVRGDDVASAVREIVRQLHDMGAGEGSRASGGFGRFEKYLKLRASSFTSNLALLDEALRMACVDSVPILIVLDGLDAFIGGTSSSGGAGGEGTLSRNSEGVAGRSMPSARQLLLYHLLDRVADHKSSISLVGITSHLSTVGMFEKRVQSRAQGTSRVIYFGHPPSFQVLVDILLSKFDVGLLDDSIVPKDKEGNGLRDQVANMLDPSACSSSATNFGDDETISNATRRVRDAFLRSYQLGMDVRWFSRVLSVALSLLAEDIDCSAFASSDESVEEGKSEAASDAFQVTLKPEYLIEGVMVMGGMADDGDGQPEDAHRADAAQTDSNLYSIVPRVQPILDLSNPELAVLLSARRILARDGEVEGSGPSKPLMFDRIAEEYEAYRHRSGAGSHRVDRTALSRAFRTLLDSGVVRPSADHTGGGPLQYCHGRSASADWSAAGRMPLHVTVDLEELDTVLRGGGGKAQVDCLTGLRHWALKTN